MAKMTFDQWKREVEFEITRKTGMHADDIDDWRYLDDYKDGISPKRSAARAIRNAKEACGIL